MRVITDLEQFIGQNISLCQNLGIVKIEELPWVINPKYYDNEANIFRLVPFPNAWGISIASDLPEIDPNSYLFKTHSGKRFGFWEFHLNLNMIKKFNMKILMVHYDSWNGFLQSIYLITKDKTFIEVGV